jgi:hypothetical protein
MGGKLSQKRHVLVNIFAHNARHLPRSFGGIVVGVRNLIET